jgi:hypothetical protein
MSRNAAAADSDSYRPDLLHEDEPRYLRRQKPVEIRRKKFGGRSASFYRRAFVFGIVATALITAAALAGDFLYHSITVLTTRGRQEPVEWRARPVADFYVELMGALAAAGVPTKISELPSEVPSPIPFPSDTEHQTYEPEPVTRFWHAMTSIDIVLKAHRARFRGKVSPVQFFWGSFDLAYTRYSGRLLDPPRDADVIMRYSHDAEQTCVGFWPGDTTTPEPAFYAYTYPSPSGIENASVGPASAGWSTELGEFLLPYEAVRTADDPRAMLLDFLETAYRAGAELARWDPALAPRIATLT